MKQLKIYSSVNLKRKKKDHREAHQLSLFNPIISTQQHELNERKLQSRYKLNHSRNENRKISRSREIRTSQNVRNKPSQFSQISKRISHLDDKFQKNCQKILTAYGTSVFLKRLNKNLQIRKQAEDIDKYMKDMEMFMRKLIPIDLHQNAQHIAKRIKHRHSHLTKFNKQYYSQENKIDFLRLTANNDQK